MAILLTGDNNHHTDTPYINYTIILVCAVLVVLKSIDPQLIIRWGFLLPEDYKSYLHADLFLRSVTSIFLHANIGHFLINAYFLWVFGDNIEYAMGRCRYIVFFLLCGFVASWSQILIRPVVNIPIVGMSGAVAGVMGAYARIFPDKPIGIYIYHLYFIARGDASKTFRAISYISLWFLANIFYGYITRDTVGGGVAYWAHAGGLVIGYVTAKWFRDHDTLLIENIGAMPLKVAKDRWAYLKAVKDKPLREPKYRTAPPNRTKNKAEEEKIQIKDDIITF